MLKLILLLFFLISCGRVDVKTESGVGQRVSTEPIVVDSFQMDIIKSVCDAISKKTESISSLVNTKVLFSYAKKECTSSSLGAPSDVITFLRLTALGPRLIDSSGAFFYFSEVETSDEGSMAKICQKIKLGQELKNPIAEGSEYTYFTTSAISGNDCDAKFNQPCILIQMGTDSGSGLAKIHTKEWIRFDLRVDQGRQGFFNLKKQVSSIGCEEGQGHTDSAVVK